MQAPHPKIFPMPALALGLPLAIAGIVLAAAPVRAQTVLATNNATIRSSLCVGSGCQSGIPFSDSTIILKENNTRIKFADNSGGSFPANDWEIEANSNSSGGASYWGINDCGTTANDGGCATDLVFAIEAGARSSALYVESDGDIGIGTSNPVTDLHVVTGNTPTLRLHQDASSGFAAQIWDLAGNETSFFLRDATNGSTLPFRVFPGSSSGSLVVRDDNVGIGTTSPDAPLHIRRNGPSFFQLEDATGETWNIQSNGTDFRITNATTAGVELALTQAGDMTILGTLTQGSDKNNKMAIEPLDLTEVLEKVAALEVSAWTYKHDAESGIRHIGPMAQDFYALFGTGATEKGISTIDTAGVALAAIKALHAQNGAQKAVIAELAARIEELEKTLH